MSAWSKKLIPSSSAALTAASGFPARALGEGSLCPAAADAHAAVDDARRFQRGVRNAVGLHMRWKILRRCASRKWGTITTGARSVKSYVVLAGNIGAGKSTLVSMMCERLGWEPYYEPVTENPYLDDFYKDMRAWAFHSQVFFLTWRAQAHRALMDIPRAVVQDRSFYEDAEVFARALHVQGAISDRDWETYQGPLPDADDAAFPAGPGGVPARVRADTPEENRPRGRRLRSAHHGRVPGEPQRALRGMDRGVHPLARAHRAVGPAGFREGFEGPGPDRHHRCRAPARQAGRPVRLYSRSSRQDGPA